MEVKAHGTQGGLAIPYPTWLLIGLFGWTLASLGVAQEPADRLVQQLGAARFADREQAVRDLNALGPPALPALRRARQSPDPEVRTRAAQLVERIAFNQAMAPTRVPLHFRDRPLHEVLTELERHAGIPLRLDPRAGPALAARPVTLEAGEPVPFWEAIGRLADDVHLRTDLRPLAAGPDSPEIRSTLVLEEAGDRLAPVVAWGPFRLKLQNLVERRELNLDPPARPLGDNPPRPAWTLNGRLHLSAEPRLTVGPGGPVRLQAARDDQGRSLLPEPPPTAPDDPDARTPPRLPEFTGTPETMVTFDLAPRGSQRGPHLTLEGVLPVAVAALSPDPLEIPLAGATGKTFEGDDLAITLVAVGPRPEDGHTVLDLSIRPLALAVEPESGAAPARASSLVEQQIALHDARGNLLPTFMQRAEAEGPALRFRIVVVPTPDGGPPARLRYASLLRGVVEVPFTFRDVPLP